MEISSSQQSLRAIARQMLIERLDSTTAIWFNREKSGFSFYVDLSTQRGTFLVWQEDFGLEQHRHKSLIVKRYSPNKQANEDQDTVEGAILGIVHLCWANVVSIKENSIEFEDFSIVFNGDLRHIKFNYDAYVNNPYKCNLSVY